MRGRHALLLAAGQARRFGGRKLLAPWRGEPLIRAAARTALAAPVAHCIAVTGCDAELVEAGIEGLDPLRLQIVRTGDWREGMAASLRAGIGALPPDSRAVVVFLGDMPLVPREAAKVLLDALDEGAIAAEYVTAPGPEGRPAHPVAFSRALYPTLAGLQGDQGGRRLLAGLDGVRRIVTDHPGAVFDVDRPADLIAAGEAAKRRGAVGDGPAGPQMRH